MLMTFYSLQENSEFLQRKYRNFYMFMKTNMSLNRCKDFYNLKLIVMELITCGSVFFAWYQICIKRINISITITNIIKDLLMGLRVS